MSAHYVFSRSLQTYLDNKLVCHVLPWSACRVRDDHFVSDGCVWHVGASQHILSLLIFCLTVLRLNVLCRLTTDPGRILDLSVEFMNVLKILSHMRLSNLVL